MIGTANATALHILNSGGGTAVHGPSYTAYLTYSRIEEALRCIQVRGTTLILNVYNQLKMVTVFLNQMIDAV